MRDLNQKKRGGAAPATARNSGLSEPGRTLRGYLRAAQAYILISMPTGTSTIFGVFQVIWVSQVMVQTLAPGRNVKPSRVPRKGSLDRSIATNVAAPARRGFAVLWGPAFRQHPDWPH